RRRRRRLADLYRLRGDERGQILTLAVVRDDLQKEVAGDVRQSHRDVEFAVGVGGESRAAIRTLQRIPRLQIARREILVQRDEGQWVRAIREIVPATDLDRSSRKEAISRSSRIGRRGCRLG